MSQVRCPGFPIELTLRWSTKHELLKSKTTRTKHNGLTAERRRTTAPPSPKPSHIGGRVKVAVSASAPPSTECISPSETRDLMIPDSAPASPEDWLDPKKFDLYHNRPATNDRECDMANTADISSCPLGINDQVSPNSHVDSNCTVDLDWLDANQLQDEPEVPK